MYIVYVTVRMCHRQPTVAAGPLTLEQFDITIIFFHKKIRPPDYFISNLLSEYIVAYDGSYTAAVGPRLVGLRILGEGGARVEQLLGDSLRHAGTITHR